MFSLLGLGSVSIYSSIASASTLMRNHSMTARKWVIDASRCLTLRVRAYSTCSHSESTPNLRAKASGSTRSLAILLPRTVKNSPTLDATRSLRAAFKTSPSSLSRRLMRAIRARIETGAVVRCLANIACSSCLCVNANMAGCANAVLCKHAKELSADAKGALSD